MISVQSLVLSNLLKLDNKEGWSAIEKECSGEITKTDNYKTLWEWSTWPAFEELTGSVNLDNDILNDVSKYSYLKDDEAEDGLFRIQKSKQ